MTIISNIIEALKDQKEIFGDDFLCNFNISDIKISKSKPIDNFEVEIKENLTEPYKASKNNSNNLSFDSVDSLKEFESLIRNCEKCSLCNTRQNFVFGTGNQDADVLIIGEAPGADEDKQGKPFVGRAGKLLTDILKAIHFERDEVFIANILKCRPPNNRNPLPKEMEQCLPYLTKQIDIIKPKVILLLGLVAAKGVLNSNLSLTKMRGKVFEYEGIKTMVTFHPAALLRNPKWKRGCWEDVQQFRKLYDELVSK